MGPSDYVSLLPLKRGLLGTVDGDFSVNELDEMIAQSGEVGTLDDDLIWSLFDEGDSTFINCQVPMAGSASSVGLGCRGDATSVIPGGILPPDGLCVTGHAYGIRYVA